MTINAVIYARSSADCAASVGDQVECLQAVAVSQGWTVTKIFSDRPMPMKRGREQRPGEMALLTAIRTGGVNRVLVRSIDRAGRSLAELVAFLETCRAVGAEIYIHDRQIDTASNNGLSLFDVGQMLVCHVRQTRRDRILRGQAVARSLSIRFGRPPIATAKIEKVRIALAAGKGVRQVARLTGISAASVSRLKNSIGSASATA
jgi:DNA invertase Pin-like site-specific DNA recombinase